MNCPCIGKAPLLVHQWIWQKLCSNSSNLLGFHPLHIDVCMLGWGGWLKRVFKVADHNTISLGFCFSISSLRSPHSPVYFPSQPGMGRQLILAIPWLSNFRTLHVKCLSGLLLTPNGICKPMLTKLQFFSVFLPSLCLLANKVKDLHTQI